MLQTWPYSSMCSVCITTSTEFSSLREPAALALARFDEAGRGCANFAGTAPIAGNLASLLLLLRRSGFIARARTPFPWALALGARLCSAAGIILAPTPAESTASSGVILRADAERLGAVSSKATSFGARDSEIRQTAENAATKTSAGFQTLVATGRSTARILATR